MKAKAFLPLLVASACVFSSHAVFAAEEYPPMTKQEATNFQNALDEQIKLAGEKVTKILQDMSNGDHIISSADRIDLKHARNMMKVKETLVGNFVGTPSLRSPLVREKLLSVLKKDDISISDLYELQTLVAQERAKIDQQQK